MGEDIFKICQNMTGTLIRSEPGSVAGIATAYGLYGSGIECR